MLKSVLPERVTECSPEQARALVSVTRELLATVSEDGDFLFVNESFTRVLGYSAAELIGRPLTYLHPPAEASFVREKFASILREDAATVSCRCTLRTKSGQWRWFDVIASVFAIIFTLPVTVYVAMRIKLTDGGSIFYLQERLGQHGKIFRIYKISG